MTKKPIYSDTKGEDVYETETAAIDKSSTVAAPVTPADMETAQMQAGPDPVNPPLPQTVATISDIPAGQPYPTGNPPATLPKVPQNELPPAEEA